MAMPPALQKHSHRLVNPVYNLPRPSTALGRVQLSILSPQQQNYNLHCSQAFHSSHRIDAFLIMLSFHPHSLRR